MSLKITSDLAYTDTMVANQSIPSMGTDQGPNINVTENTVPGTTASGDSGRDNNDNKKLIGNPEKQIQNELSKINSQLFRTTKCEFKFYDDIHRVAVKVIDKETNEVIREIPPENTLEFIQKLWEFAGLLYDEKG